jgi:hypothetical protein
MSNYLWRMSLGVVPALMGIVGASAAQAGELEAISSVQQYAREGAAMGQVTSVSQLRDVQPTDWAFQALQSLVERYGCIAGYPDGTYRGNRAMTRYEFAAGLNACLDRVNELIASATADLVTAEDLAVLQRLQEEFQAELATLRGRVDALEARTAELEANQFSTTTKLSGTAFFDLGSAFTGEVGGASVEDEVTFGGRVNLDLNTTFTGSDLLTMRLKAANIQGYNTRFEGGVTVPEAAVDYQSDTGNAFVLDNLWYKFPVGKASVYVGTVDLEADEIAPTTANLMGDAIGDYFGVSNPLSYNVAAGAGAGFNLPLGESLNIAAAYLASEANVAGDDVGLTGGDNTTFAQLTFTPGDKLTIAGTYNYGYTSGGGGLAGGSESYSMNAFGLNAGYALSSKLTLSGWAGWGFAESKDSDDDAELFNWAVLLGFPDLFREGNYGGLSIGGFTSVVDESGTSFTEVDDTPLLAQAFYRIQLSDNVSVQPGIFYISNPGGSSDNDSVWIGSLRTKFSF